MVSEHDLRGADVRTRKRFKRAAEVAAVESLAVFARLVPARLGSAAFSTLGELATRYFGRDRERAIENLALAFPDVPAPVRAALARASFKALGRNAFEALRLASMSRDQIRARVERVEGMDNFLDVHRAGKGVIVISSELPELLAVSDRVLVLRGGAIDKEIDRADIPDEETLQLAVQGV